MSMFSCPAIPEIKKSHLREYKFNILTLIVILTFVVTLHVLLIRIKKKHHTFWTNRNTKLLEWFPNYCKFLNFFDVFIMWKLRPVNCTPDEQPKHFIQVTQDIYLYIFIMNNRLLWIIVGGLLLGNAKLYDSVHHRYFFL